MKNFNAFFIPQEIKTLLDKNWKKLSPVAKKGVQHLLALNEKEHHRMIRKAVKKNPNFSTDLHQFIKERKKKYLQEIEQDEKESELKNINI